jgi:hypothetical protein
MVFTAGAKISIKKYLYMTILSKNIMFTLSGKKTITDHLDYLCNEINAFLTSY